MEQETQECSGVPSHFRQVHCPALATQPTLRQFTICRSATSSPQTNPTTKKPRNRSIGSSLKAFIYKKPRQSVQRSSPRPPTIISIRPGAMRMKDSDDYITARAANPWTGLISPSVGTRTPCTPASPGDALRLHATEQVSPTPGTKARPPLRKANEGRKISAGSSRQVRVDNEEASRESSQAAVSDRSLASSASLPDQGDDRFVVHMPSAREPQPFAYPGYSADQIEALEHYRQKTRRVSSDGYDRRLLHANPVREDESVGRQDEHVTVHYVHGRHFTPYSADLGPDEAFEEHPAIPRLVVRKGDHPKGPRDPGSYTRVREGRSYVPTAADTTPSALPRANLYAINRRQKDEHISAFKSIPVTSQPPKNSAKLNQDRTISRKLISSDSAPSIMNVANSQVLTLNGDQYQLHDNKNGASPPDPEGTALVQRQTHQADLSKLPRVRLVKPEHAAVPQAQRRGASQQQQQKRACSFGCQREDGKEECTERRNPSNATVVIRQTSLFTSGQDPTTEEAAAQPPILVAGKMEMLVEGLTSLLNHLGALQVPRINTLELLKAHDVPAQEKIEALKAVLSLAGHALAVCTMLAMMWKVGAAVMHLVEVVLWPLAVPLRIVRWVAG